MYRVNLTHCEYAEIESARLEEVTISLNGKINYLATTRLKIYLISTGIINAWEVANCKVYKAIGYISILNIDIPTLKHVFYPEYYVIRKINIIINDVHRVLLEWTNEYFGMNYFDSGHAIKTATLDTVFLKDLSVILADNICDAVVFSAPTDETDIIMLTSVILFSDEQEIRFFDNIFNLKPKKKTKIVSKFPSLTTYASCGEFPYDAFYSDNEIVANGHKPGYYCMAAKGKRFLCPIMSNYVDFEKEPVGKDLVPDNKNIFIFLILTTQQYKPIISVDSFTNVTVSIYGYQYSDVRDHVAITESFKSNIGMSLSLSKCVVSLVSYNAVIVDILWLVNTVFTADSLIAPLQYLYIDEFSLESLSMIVPISNDPMFMERKLIATGLIDTIEVMKKNIAIVCSGKKHYISDSIMKSMTINTVSRDVYLDFVETYGVDHVEVLPSVVLMENMCNFTFKHGWDNFYVNPSKVYVKSSIYTFKIVDFYSEIEHWPRQLYSIVGDDVKINSGGKYCIFVDDASKCPRDFLKIAWNRLPSLRRMYSDSRTHSMEIKLFDTSNDHIPVVCINKMDIITSITITSNEQGYLILDISKQKGLLPPLNLNSVFLKIHSENEKVFETSQVTLDKNSMLFLNNHQMRVLSFTTHSTKYSNIYDSFLDQELTTITLDVDNRVNTIQAYEDFFYLIYEYNMKAKFSCAFLSVTVIVVEEVFPISIGIESIEHTAKRLPNIIPRVLNGLTITFKKSCYKLNIDKKVIISSPLEGSLTLISDEVTAPSYFLIPFESKTVHYNFAPKAVSTPSEVPEASIKTIYISYFSIIGALFLIVFIIIQVTVLCHKSPSIAHDELFTHINSINTMDNDDDDDDDDDDISSIDAKLRNVRKHRK